MSAQMIANNVRKMPEQGADRIGRHLAEAAQRRVLEDIVELVDGLERVRGGAPYPHTVEQVEHAL
jgi:predicted nuclease with TOPRIM domain